MQAACSSLRSNAKLVCFIVNALLEYTHKNVVEPPLLVPSLTSSVRLSSCLSKNLFSHELVTIY